MKKKKYTELISLDTYCRSEGLDKGYFISSNNLSYQTRPVRRPPKW